MKPCPKWTPPSALELAAMTVIPVAGILWFGWSGFQILLLYWCENAVIGAINVLRMVLAKTDYRTQADCIAAHPWLLQHYPITEEEWVHANGRATPSVPNYKPFFVPIFIGHYTFFMVIHAMLLAALVRQLPLRDWSTMFALEWNPQLLLALAAMSITHAWRFWKEDLQGRRSTRTLPVLAMIYPYRQLLIMHVALTLGGLALVFFALPPAVAIVLILLKAGFDMNWIRFPFGPKEIDWSKMIESKRKGKSGSIVGKNIEERPDTSNASLREMDSGLDFDLPPQGISEVWRKMRAGGCLLIGSMFLVIPMIIFGKVFNDFGRSSMDGGSGAYWPVLIVMTGALIAGTYLMLVVSVLASTVCSVIAYGKLRGRIVVGSATLKIHQTGVLFSRSGEFDLADIHDIGMSPTGDRTNEFSVCELRLRLEDESEHTFLTGRDPDELNWVATKIMLRLLR
ncbi:MAG: DUF6498-containing protein [Verrucomicrobiia bacterium]|jgi:hypothetical protein